MKNGMAIAIAFGLSAAISLPATAQVHRDDDHPHVDQRDRSMMQERPMMQGRMMQHMKSMLNPDAEQARQHVDDWPAASNKAANQMLDSYGAPDEITADALIWRNNGPWHKSVVVREPVQHNFPSPHQDVLAQTVFHDIPLEHYSDIARFDGSVILDRTKGTMTARCDNEAANFLALNLAQQIVRGERSIDQARSEYAQQMDRFMETGQKTALLRGLQFSPMTAARAGDPDQPFDRVAMGDDY
jgi:hypothetical protein